MRRERERESERKYRGEDKEQNTTQTELNPELFFFQEPSSTSYLLSFLFFHQPPRVLHQARKGKRKRERERDRNRETESTEGESQRKKN